MKDKELEKNSKMLTIHKAQGLTYQNWIVNRLTDKELIIFLTKAHTIVAVSRYTQTLTYSVDTNAFLNRIRS